MVIHNAGHMSFGPAENRELLPEASVEHRESPLGGHHRMASKGAASSHGPSVPIPRSATQVDIAILCAFPEVSARYCSASPRSAEHEIFEYPK